MSLIHTIRLRGPWELTPLRSAAATSKMLPGGEPLGFELQTITQQLPAAWDDVLPGFRGTVRYSRRFGRPTNLEAHERVWLVVADVAGSPTIRLNGENVSDLSVDVTDRLLERNLLQIEVTQTDPRSQRDWSARCGWRFAQARPLPGNELAHSDGRRLQETCALEAGFARVILNAHDTYWMPTVCAAGAALACVARLAQASWAERPCYARHCRTCGACISRGGLL